MSDQGLCQGQCHVTVVLLVLGRGGDPNSYRPKRDESQWWSRRDALVRCVTSFLFGPSPLVGTARKEMILIFDDDWAQMHLSLDGGNGRGTVSIVPAEQTILSVFKQAAQSLNVEIISREGLKCRIVLDPMLLKGNNGKVGPSSELPTGLDSKRQVLEYLQKNCSIDFLRTNGLNSNPTVILRKTNKKALMEVWSKWRRHANETSKDYSASAGSSSSSNQKIIESLYSNIIRKSKEAGTTDTTIVGTLHETCEEFPCFGQMDDDDSRTSENLRILMFLGAVRDMTVQENQILAQVCKRQDVPQVGVRFGTVPEFTSKILSILAFHHSHQHTLKGAMKRLLDKGANKWSADPSPLRQATSLHVICTVPMKSEDVSLDLAQRDRVHWSIVRVVVCTLWRSRLASSDASSKIAHINTLTFLFDDGVVLNLSEEAFVSKLASQHQAAPSEYQILAAIRTLLDSKSPPQGKWSKKAVASQVVDSIVETSSQRIQSTISISPGGGSNLSEQFFTADLTDDESQNSQNTVMVVLEIQKGSPVSESNQQKSRKLHRAIMVASEKNQIPVLHQSIVSNVVDYEGASITCLQHLLYQNRLFPSAMPSTKLTGKKRKPPL